MFITQASALPATLQRIKASPGPYYDHVGEAQLYNTEWKIVTYINLEDADYSLETVKKYAQLPTEFCKIHEHTR
jgi:AICAR transformylase/IMP cyclohydrolase PurH